MPQLSEEARGRLAESLISAAVVERPKEKEENEEEGGFVSNEDVSKPTLIRMSKALEIDPNETKDRKTRQRMEEIARWIMQESKAKTQSQFILALRQMLTKLPRAPMATTRLTQLHRLMVLELEQDALNKEKKQLGF